jgi:hypothetical protein
MGQRNIRVRQVANKMRIVFLMAYGYLVKDTNLELVSGHLYGRLNHVYFPTH